MTTAVAHRVANAEVARLLREIADLLEVNGQPERLDLDDVMARRAIELGCRIAIDTDAHSAAELGFMRWGVDQARRAWVTRTDAINTKPLPQLVRLLARHRAAG